MTINYRVAIEDLHPTVEFRWGGGDAGDFSQIMDWDRNGTGITKPTQAELNAHWDVMQQARQTEQTRIDQLVQGDEAIDISEFDAQPAVVRKLARKLLLLEARLNGEV